MKLQFDKNSNKLDNLVFFFNLILPYNNLEGYIYTLTWMRMNLKFNFILNYNFYFLKIIKILN